MTIKNSIKNNICESQIPVFHKEFTGQVDSSVYDTLTVELYSPLVRILHNNLQNAIFNPLYEIFKSSPG